MGPSVCQQVTLRAAGSSPHTVEGGGGDGCAGIGRSWSRLPGVSTAWDGVREFAEAGLGAGVKEAIARERESRRKEE